MPANSLVLPGGEINVCSAEVSHTSPGAVPLTFFFEINSPSMPLNLQGGIFHAFPQTQAYVFRVEI